MHEINTSWQPFTTYCHIEQYNVITDASMYYDSDNVFVGQSMQVMGLHARMS